MSTISFSTQAVASSDANKVATSPPWGGGLGAQSRLLPKLRPRVTRVKSPLHHIEEVACELNLGAPFGSSHYYPETIPVVCTGRSHLGFAHSRLVVVLSLGARVIILR